MRASSCSPHDPPHDPDDQAPDDPPARTSGTQPSAVVLAVQATAHSDTREPGDVHGGSGSSPNAIRMGQRTSPSLAASRTNATISASTASPSRSNSPEMAAAAARAVRSPSHTEA